MDRPVPLPGTLNYRKIMVDHPFPQKMWKGRGKTCVQRGFMNDIKGVFPICIKINHTVIIFIINMLDNIQVVLAIIDKIHACTRKV
jgi:hypothetical protein